MFAFLSSSRGAALLCALFVFPLGLTVNAAGLSGVELNVSQSKGDVSYFMHEAGADGFAYKVNYAQLTGGTLIQEGLASGRLDVAHTSEVPAIFSVSQGATRIIGSLESDINMSGVLVHRNSGINTVAQLKGKRIGYLRASNKQLFLLSLLHDAGLNMTDIVPVPLPHQEAASAFASGHIDAWIMDGVQTVIAQKQYDATLIAEVNSRYAGFYTISSSLQSLNDPAKSQAIGDYLARMVKTYRWMAAHPDQVAAKSAKLLGVDPQSYFEFFSRRSADPQILPVSAKAISHQQGVADFLLSSGVLRNHVDVAGLWDNRFNALIDTANHSPL